MKIYVKGITDRTDKRIIEDFFKRFGPVQDVVTGFSDYAFVEMKYDSDSEEVLRVREGLLDGRRVFFERAKEDRPRGERGERDPRDGGRSYDGGRDRYNDRGGDRYNDRGGDRYGGGRDRYNDRDGGRYNDRDGGRYGDRGGDRYNDRDGGRYGDRGGDRYNDRRGRSPPRTMRDSTCYNCRRVGHFARDCPDRPRNPMYSDTRGTLNTRYHPYGGDNDRFRNNRGNGASGDERRGDDDRRVNDDRNGDDRRDDDREFRGREDRDRSPPRGSNGNGESYNNSNSNNGPASPPRGDNDRYRNDDRRDDDRDYRRDEREHSPPRGGDSPKNSP